MACFRRTRGGVVSGVRVSPRQARYQRIGRHPRGHSDLPGRAWGDAARRTPTSTASRNFLRRSVRAPGSTPRWSRSTASASVPLWNCVPHDWDEPDTWVRRALFEVERCCRDSRLAHGGDVAPAGLPRRSGCARRRGRPGLPDSCVPIRNGVRTGPLEDLTRP